MAIISKIGEHDLSKEPCCKNCKISSTYCALSNKTVNTTLWTGTSRTVKGTDIPADSKGDQYPDNGGYLDGCNCWGDGSGFEYDTLSMNLIGPHGSQESVYDIYNYGIGHSPFQFSSWNAWIEKFQYDYRFGRVSDLNAETVLFPNNDNPWMFTEYVFKGTGKFYDANSGSIKTSDTVVIEPPLFDEDTLNLINGDFATTKTKFSGKYKEADFEDGKVKQYRQLKNWDIWHPDEKKRKNGDWISDDAGAKLYKVNINVQCVKWGEHGNVPPHSIDMTAPADWFDPTHTVSKVKAVYKAHIGSPLYANAYGVIQWTDDIAYIGETSFVSATDADGVPYYTYENPGDGIEQDMPKNTKGKIVKPSEILKDTGEYIHGGCGLCKASGGKVICQAMEGLDKESDMFKTLKTNFEELSSCMAFNNASHCEKYVGSKEFPAIASYQSTASNMSEYYAAAGFNKASSNARNELRANAILTQSTGLPMADMFVAMGFTTMGAQFVRPDCYTPDTTQIWYELTFENQYAASEPMQLNKEWKDFGKGVQIVQGTGKFALDTQQNANPFQGGDTNCYDDINVLSFHRFYSSVMHCATQANCNECNGFNQKDGFTPGQRAGGDGKCKYYRGKDDQLAFGKAGCPYTCVPKRAYEFGETMNVISKELKSLAVSYSELTAQGLMDLDADEQFETENIWERKNGGSIVYNTYFFKRESSKRVICFIKDDNSGNWGGVELPKKSGGSGEYKYALCKFKIEQTSAKIKNKEDKEKSIKIDTVTDCFFWYKPLDDAGNELTKSSECHVDNDHLWFCKTDDDFVRCFYNSVIIDNEDKFIGGYHPQYKDYGQIGQEFMQEVESEYEREGQGMGDVGVGDSDYSGIPFPTNKKGYWVDESGCWIMDERSLGLDQPLADDQTRASAGGPGTCISIKKSNTEINGETGEQTSPKTINGAVYSNDSYALVYTTFKAARHKTEDGKIEGRPMLEDPNDAEGKMYYAPCYIRMPYFLPTKRKAAYCPKCDYYISHKYYSVGKCPWCGTAFKEIKGDDGPSESGETWPKDADVIKKFFKLYAIGQVQVWGPPGMCVRRDAYYWRHPAVISNGIRNQIYHRLGSANEEGGYSFGGMSPASEATLGYPESVGCYKPVPPGGDEASDQRYSKASGIAWNNDEDTWENGSYNDIAPKQYMPLLGGTKDEGVIAPSTNASNDALKMVSYNQMRVLRNAVEPVLAYTMDAFGGDYPTMRCSYNQREKRVQNIIYAGRRAQVSPVVLASSGDGADAFQQYYSGDLAYGAVREYYPPGYSWWYLKQVLGGISSNCTGGKYHMDDGKGGAGLAVYSSSGKVVSKAMMFIHGILPLDKEIVKAYIITGPGGVDASKDPIGRSWNGGPIMYHHYHAFKKDHFGDGTSQHLHGTAGWPGNGARYFDEEGNYVDNAPGVVYFADDDNPVKYQDEGTFREWGSPNHEKEGTNSGWYDSDQFLNTMTNLPAMLDISFYQHVGTAKGTITKDGQTKGYGYTDASAMTGWQYQNLTLGSKTDIKFQYIYLNGDNNIVQQYSNSEIWKTNTKETIDKSIGRYTYDVEFEASDGTEENTVSYKFTETRTDLSGDIIPNNAQDITGYFDMSWTNTTGKLIGNYKVEENLGTPWTSPVIFQDVEETATSYGGSDAQTQTGYTTRLIDVTGLVTSLYNSRIPRSFSCQAGKTWEIAKAYRPSEEWPKMKGTLTALDDDVANQNYYIDGGGGYLLTDIYSYPLLDNNEVPSISGDGDKFELASSESEIVCELMFPVTIGSSNNKYKVNGSKGVLSNGTYTKASEVKTILGKIFPGTGIEVLSKNTIRITSGSDIEVEDIADNCYGSLGFAADTYPAQQNRILSVTSYVSGYHPSKLMNDGEWIYNTYSPDTQSFVCDLARAPYCKSQRNYRYKEASSDYSNCKCTVEDCYAYENTAAVAANMHEKTWNSSSSTCPWGHELDPSNVISEAGDGIMTYEYEPKFNDNPFITGLTITADKCSYRVSIRDTESSGWKTLLDVYYDSSSGEYFENYPNNGTGSSSRTLTFNKTTAKRARFIQVQCESQPSLIEHTFNVKSVDNYSMILSGDFSEMDTVSLAGTKLEIGGETYKVMSSAINNEEKSEMRIGLNKSLGNSNPGSVTFEINKYLGGITKFAVYGFHYTEKQGDEDYANAHYLNITGFEDEQQIALDTKTSRYTMSEAPTQILSVEVGRAGSGGIVLKKSSTATGLKWQTIDMDVVGTDGKKYKIKRITGGEYYYDPLYGNLWIPRTDTGDDNGNEWGYYENDGGVEDEDPVPLARSFLPSTLTIKYWSGNGKTITLPATACGNGPSYQLEKDAIQYFSGGTFDDNGVTCKMLDADGNVVDNQPIPWSVYNSTPACLDIAYSSNAVDIAGYVGAKRTAGEFGKPSFVGNELAADIDDKGEKFASLFGDHCERLQGQCKTTVVFTGAPNKVISGNITCTAAAYTTKTVNCGGGVTMKVNQRTGGLDKGCFQVCLKPGNCEGGRCSPTYSIPSLLIYAKESKPMEIT